MSHRLQRQRASVPYVYKYCHRSSDVLCCPFTPRPEPPLQGGTGVMTSQRGKIPHGRRAGHATQEQPRNHPALARLYCDRIIDC